MVFLINTYFHIVYHMTQNFFDHLVTSLESHIVQYYIHIDVIYALQCPSCLAVVQI